MGWISSLGSDISNAASWLSGDINDAPQAVKDALTYGDPSVRLLLSIASNTSTDIGVLIQTFAPGLYGLYLSDREDFDRWFGQQRQQAASQPQQASTTQAPKTPPAGQIRGQIPANVDPSVVDAVLRAAQATGVPYPLALAIAEQESGFNANAHTQTAKEDSWGVFQLNTMGGEGENLPQYILQDPYQNALVALRHVADYMRAHPGQDWGTIAANAQGADNTGNKYASAVNNYVSQIQTGQGDMGWGLSAIKTGDPTFQANSQYGANNVFQPFSAGYFQDVSQSFGQNGEEGTDFAMPVGQNIVTPVGGTVTLVDDGKKNWGKAVYIKTPNGWTFFVGHLSSFEVQNGQQVGPGDLIGASGGDPNDPSSGVSNGAHIEIRFIDASGQNHDPMPFLQQIYSGTGTTYDKWMGGLFSGSAQPAPIKQNIVMAGDGQLVDLNTPEGAWWKTVDTAWSAVYGVHAPLQAAQDFRNAGITTVDALNNAINNMPSSIPGVTIGSFKALSDATNSAAQAAFGRSVPQSLISQFFQQGITTQGAIKLWFDTHSSADIPTADYQAIYDTMLPQTQALSGDVPHPADISQVYQQATSYPSSGPGSVKPNPGQGGI